MKALQSKKSRLFIVEGTTYHQTKHFPKPIREGFERYPRGIEEKKVIAPFYENLDESAEASGYSLSDFMKCFDVNDDKSIPFLTLTDEVEAIHGSLWAYRTGEKLLKNMEAIVQALENSKQEANTRVLTKAQHKVISSVVNKKVAIIKLFCRYPLSEGSLHYHVRNEIYKNFAIKSITKLLSKDFEAALNTIQSADITVIASNTKRIEY